MPFRIISMDGGNGYNTAVLLVDIEKRLRSESGNRGYLDAVDLFAGTSDGALNALFFATQDDPTLALNDILTYWSNVNTAMFKEAITPLSIAAGLSGLKAISSSEQLRESFISYFGAQTTLGDLKHKVFIVSFQLDNETAEHRQWVPRFYSNLRGGEGATELVVDVAMRTTAFPILRPIYQALSGQGPGYVDGGVVANQPSMSALAGVYGHLDAELDREAKPEDVLLFSIGTGQNPVGRSTFLDPKFSNGFADWGYFQWLTDPSNPLLLVNLLLQSTAEAVDYQCRRLLRRRYHRLNPQVKLDLVQQDSATEEDEKKAIEWMLSIGWLEEEPDQSKESTKGNRKAVKTPSVKRE